MKLAQGESNRILPRASCSRRLAVPREMWFYRETLKVIIVALGPGSIPVLGALTVSLSCFFGTHFATGSSGDLGERSLSRPVIIYRDIEY